jgi:transcriptional regulator with XRE-family HTH domain
MDNLPNLPNPPPHAQPAKPPYGANIRYYRKRAGLTQAELAEHLGWGRNGEGGISMYENAKHSGTQPGTRLLERIAHACGCTVADLCALETPALDQESTTHHRNEVNKCLPMP